MTPTGKFTIFNNMNPRNCMDISSKDWGYFALLVLMASEVMWIMECSTPLIIIETLLGLVALTASDIFEGESKK